MKLLDDAIKWAWENAGKHTELTAFFEPLSLPEGHFSRLFHAFMRTTFSEYYRRVTLYRTLRIVQETAELEPIVTAGFDSYDAFKRLLGVENDTVLMNVDAERHRPKTTYEHPTNAIDEGTPVELEAKDFLGFIARGSNMDAQIKENWKKLTSRLSVVKYDYPDHRAGLMPPIRDKNFTLNNPSQGGFSYFCAQEVYGFTTTQKPFLYRMLPQRRFLRFTHKDGLETISDTYKQIFATGLANASATYDEDYVYETFEETADGLIVHIHVPIKATD